MGENNAGDTNNATEDNNNEGAGQDGADGGQQKDPGGNTDGKGSDDGEGDDGSDPEVRKRDFIIARMQRREAKQNANKNKDGNDGAGDGAGNDDGDEIPEEDERLVTRVIDKRYGDIFTKQEEAQDKAELSKFLGDNPEFKTYETKIWRFWQHESRRHLPVSTIAYEVAGKNLLKIGAARAKQADEKAKENANSGRSNVDTGKKAVEDMTYEEFMAHKEAVKRKQAQ
jgi:hypothetical protein